MAVAAKRKAKAASRSARSVRAGARRTAARRKVARGGKKATRKKVAPRERGVREAAGKDRWDGRHGWNGRGRRHGKSGRLRRGAALAKFGGRRRLDRPRISEGPPGETGSGGPSPFQGAAGFLPPRLKDRPARLTSFPPSRNPPSMASRPGS